MTVYVVPRVVPISTPLVDERVVALLEHALLLAREGQVIGVAMATLERDGTGSHIAGTAVRADIMRALGAVDILKQRMLREMVEWD